VSNIIEMNEDIYLIERFKMYHDEDAFNKLIMKYQKSIYYMAIRMLKNHDDALDIVQNTFIKGFLGINKFNGKSSFKTWLFKIALNLCRNHLRDNKNRRVKNINDKLERNYIQDSEDCIKPLLDKLPEKQRITLILKVYQGFSYKEISQIMKVSVGTAKANYSHAINNLRSLIK